MVSGALRARRALSHSRACAVVGNRGARCFFFYRLELAEAPRGGAARARAEVLGCELDRWRVGGTVVAADTVRRGGGPAEQADDGSGRSGKGKEPAEGEEPDLIRNGADDDASGVACVVALAEAFAAGAPPARTPSSPAKPIGNPCAAPGVSSSARPKGVGPQSATPPGPVT